MVYPRESGVRTLSKFIAVCALACSLHSAAAVDVTATTTSAAVCTAADGDIAVGVQAIPDASCVAGGLGCYSSSCRFCKYSETSKSAHLLTCSSFGYSFPTLAPEPSTAPAAASAGDCGISDGDLAVGIRAVTDASCVIGGLGCYSTHCRYCKEVETPQSAHLASCSTFATVTTPPATTAPATTTPALIATPSPVAETVAPVGDTVAPVADTIAPVVDTAAPAIVTDTVAPAVVDTVAPAVIDTVAPAAVDTAAPAVIDTVAPAAVDTAAPAVVDTMAPSAVIPYTETPAGTTAAPTTGEPVFGQADYVATECSIDESFKVLGIDVVADPTVTNLDTDYYTDGCRFCKTVDSIEYESFTFCALFPTYYTTTTAPTTVVPEVNTSAPLATIDTAAPSTAPAFVCTTNVSEGDAAAGIQIITDASCTAGGLGCIDTICRFCKVASTPLSDHLDNCSALLGSSSSSLDETCDTVISPGDSAIGLAIVTDAKCVSVGGLGCIGETACKFCKQVETEQSAVYEYCDGYPVASTGSGAATASVSIPLPTVSAINVAVACAGNELSTGDAEGGVAYTYDPENCPAGTTAGCLGQTGCKFCKKFDSTVSSHLDYCPGYPAATPAFRVQGSPDEAQTATANSIDKFLRQNTYFIAAAACVGAVAVIAVAVVGAKRVVRRLRRSEAVTEEDEEAASALSAEIKDEATVTAEEANASLPGEL